MVEAWQKREIEQRQLINGLQSDVFLVSENEEGSYGFLLVAAGELLKGFLARKIGSATDGVGEKARERACEWISQATEKIRAFCKTDEEFLFLLVKLLEKLIENGAHYIQCDYLRQKVLEPEKLYEGHEAMDEVPL